MFQDFLHWFFQPKKWLAKPESLATEKCTYIFVLPFITYKILPSAPSIFIELLLKSHFFQSNSLISSFQTFHPQKKNSASLDFLKNFLDLAIWRKETNPQNGSVITANFT